MQKLTSSFFWLWIPVFVMALQLILEATLSGDTLSHLLSENGPYEAVQALLMLFSFLFALFCFFKKDIAQTYLLRFWFGLAAVCSLYVAGEEVSWGQHIWDWITPEFWMPYNDQQETNLHNTSSWFDQKPRLILILGIVIGTLIIPVLKKYNLVRFPDNLDMLLPSKKLSVIALLVVVPQIFEKIFESMGMPIFARFSEVQEAYIFYFVFLYLVMLSAKIKAQ